MHYIAMAYAWDKLGNTTSNYRSIGFKTHTSLGKTFSAARLGTEKPPCVLVSLAVKVLQKKSIWCPDIWGKK